MVAVKSQDVMDKLLSCEKVDQFPEVEELNYLIYRNPDNPPSGTASDSELEQIWTASKDKVTVQVWDSRASIRIRVSHASHQDISIKHIADIAVNAIVDELRRDKQ